jgi:hypothetical protein
MVRELMLEHFEFWASDECPPLSQEDLELIERLSAVVHGAHESSDA